MPEVSWQEVNLQYKQTYGSFSEEIFCVTISNLSNSYAGLIKEISSQTSQPRILIHLVSVPAGPHRASSVWSSCPKGLLCREVPKIGVCLSVRSFVRPSVRPSVRSSGPFSVTFRAPKMELSKGYGQKGRSKQVPKCQKCNALDLRSEGKWLSFGMAYGTSSINALRATLPCRSNLVFAGVVSRSSRKQVTDINCTFFTLHTVDGLMFLMTSGTDVTDLWDRRYNRHTKV